MQKFIAEFKEFAIKGNALELAVAVIVGTAFGKIVTSLVNDLIMPLFGVILGGFNFQDLVVIVGKSQIKYGSFLQSVVDFLLVALSIFLMVKLINRISKKKEEVEENTKTKLESEELLILKEIRDLLKAPSKS